MVVTALLEDDHWGGGGGTGLIERLYDPPVIYIPLSGDIDHRQPRRSNRSFRRLANRVMTIGYSRTHTRMPVVYNYVRIHMLSSHFVNAAAGRAVRETLAAIGGTSWGTCHMRYPLKRIDFSCLLLDRPSNSLTFDRRRWCRRPRRGAPFSELYTQGLNRPACHQRIEGLSVS